MDAFLGYVTYFGFSFAPKNWQQCNGQILAINTNAALFSLLGTYYGGNGTTTFGLPDLRGRTIVGYGANASGVQFPMGEKAGAEGIGLLATNLPAHAHTTSLTVPVSSTQATDPTPAGEYLAATSTNMYAATSTPNAKYGGTITVGVNGSSVPVPLMNPFVVLNACICQYGIFPSRN